MFFFTYDVILIGVVSFIFWYIFVKRNPAKLNGIYSQKGKFYWLKFYFIYFLMKRRQKERAQNTKNEEEWNKSLESKKKLPAGQPKAVDAVFFNGANKDGYYFAVGTAHRPANIMNTFFILRIPGLGILENIEMPTTNLPVDDVAGAYSAKGVTIKCLEPMKRWHISYHGPMQLRRARYTPVKVTVKMVWTNFGPHFDFDAHSSPEAIARALAIEPWSRELFSSLKASHQMHYEQFGDVEASIDIEGQPTAHVLMRSMRDHTVAKHRDWAQLRRYIMTIFHLDDGTCIHTSLVSMPNDVFSHLEMGYMVTKDKKTFPVDRIDVSLADLGEDGVIPGHFSYAFYAAGQRYDVSVKLIDATTFIMGLEDGGNVVENMAEFEVNGMKGQGLTEWEYGSGYGIVPSPPTL